MAGGTKIMYCRVPGCPYIATICIGHTTGRLVHVCNVHAEQFRKGSYGTQASMLRNATPIKYVYAGRRHG